MKRRPTVTDVAVLANVGASTVSRFLRGVPVKPAVAERVKHAVESLGYEPDERARSLRVGRSRTIGVILPKVSNVFFSQSIQTMEEEAGQRGCTVILLTHQDVMAQQMNHLATLRRYRVDGVVITCAQGTTPMDIRGALPHIPVVAFDSSFSDEIDSVILRNRDAARTATEHLLGHGYRKIACVTGKPGVYSFLERSAGYAEAMTARGLEPNLISGPDYEQVRYRLGMAMRTSKPPEALLSLSDLATLNIFKTFEELALKPEQRAAIIGFDDFAFAPLIDPPLTVVRQPVEKMVRYALNVLFSRIDGTASADIQNIALPGELICRRSCGCL
jgi:LacI family transcriptional regulator